MLKIQNFEKLWHFPCRRWTQVRAAWTRQPWLSLKTEVQPTSLDGGGSDLWVWAVVFCCDSCASPLVHSGFFPFKFRRICFLAEFWVNTNGWLRRPWSGAADGFAQTILWGGVQLYVTDFVSGPTCSQAPRRAPLWGPFSVPVLAVPGGAQLVTFNRPIWAIARSQRDLGWSWKRSVPASCKTI